MDHVPLSRHLKNGKVDMTDAEFERDETLNNDVDIKKTWRGLVDIQSDYSHQPLLKKKNKNIKYEITQVVTAHKKWTCSRSS